jgi:hypothetical protein
LEKEEKEKKEENSERERTIGMKNAAFDFRKTI